MNKKNIDYLLRFNCCFSFRAAKDNQNNKSIIADSKSNIKTNRTETTQVKSAKTSNDQNAKNNSSSATSRFFKLSSIVRH